MVLILGFGCCVVLYVSAPPATQDVYHSAGCFVTAAVCSSILGTGSTVGFPAILLPQLHLPGSLVRLTKDDESWLTSILAMALLIGNFLATSMMDQLGRRVTHFTMCVPGIVGWVITVMAANFQTLFIGRILLGISVGLSLPFRSVLIGEYTSPKNRGAFLTTVSVAQAFGIFFVHLVGSFTSWQITALICVSFPFTSLVMMMYCPESPSYLASKGKYEECRDVFRWLRGDDEEQELEDLIEARKLFDAEKSDRNLRDAIKIVKTRVFYKPILLMIHVQGMMQFSGGNTMAAYSTVIIGMIMGPDADVNFWMIALDVQRIVFNCAAVFIINRYRRRTMMFSTGTLCVLSHLAIAGYVYAKIHNLLLYDALWIPILLINLQFLSVGVGMVPLPNVIGGEVFPLEYRSIGSSIGIVPGALFTFIVLKTFPAFTSTIGLHGTYTFFAGALTYFLTVIWFLLPETKGRTLQEIEDEFRGRPLKLEEEEERKSLQLDARKMSMISARSMAIEIS